MLTTENTTARRHRRRGGSSKSKQTAEPAAGPAPKTDDDGRKKRNDQRKALPFKNLKGLEEHRAEMKESIHGQAALNCMKMFCLRVPKSDERSDCAYFQGDQLVFSASALSVMVAKRFMDGFPSGTLVHKGSSVINSHHVLPSDVDYGFLGNFNDFIVAYDRAKTAIFGADEEEEGGEDPARQIVPGCEARSSYFCYTVCNANLIRISFSYDVKWLNSYETMRNPFSIDVVLYGQKDILHIFQVNLGDVGPHAKSDIRDTGFSGSFDVIPLNMAIMELVDACNEKLTHSNGTKFDVSGIVRFIASCLVVPAHGSCKAPGLILSVLTAGIVPSREEIAEMIGANKAGRIDPTLAIRTLYRLILHLRLLLADMFKEPIPYRCADETCIARREFAARLKEIIAERDLRLDGLDDAMLERPSELLRWMLSGPQYEKIVANHPAFLHQLNFMFPLRDVEAAIEWHGGLHYDRIYEYIPVRTSVLLTSLKVLSVLTRYAPQYSENWHAIVACLNVPYRLLADIIDYITRRTHLGHNLLVWVRMHITMMHLSDELVHGSRKDTTLSHFLHASPAFCSSILARVVPGIALPVLRLTAARYYAAPIPRYFVHHDDSGVFPLLGILEIPGAYRKEPVAIDKATFMNRALRLRYAEFSKEESRVYDEEGEARAVAMRNGRYVACAKERTFFKLFDVNTRGQADAPTADDGSDEDDA